MATNASLSLHMMQCRDRTVCLDRGEDIFLITEISYTLDASSKVLERARCVDDHRTSLGRRCWGAQSSSRVVFPCKCPVVQQEMTSQGHLVGEMQSQSGYLTGFSDSLYRAARHSRSLPLHCVATLGIFDLASKFRLVLPTWCACFGWGRANCLHSNW